MAANIEKIDVQICFAKDADLNKVRKQLEDLVAEDKYAFKSCFLPRHIVEEKGWSTEIVDLLDEVLGVSHIYMLGRCDTFDIALGRLPEIRKITANLVDKMFVLDAGAAAGVAEEIRLFTEQKVILLP